ncbi:MAG TPA: nascent polypeptide-associated complex protein, partial [Candidatus Nanoarchaeia archaeon]|nr:nascent polypeptide-associated complex protein [Candidatus Nanoarchaeia archaeon]
MNPKQVQQMMKKMGIQQTEIPATEVIIRTNNGDIIIKHPQVSKVNMSGQTTYQVVGEAEGATTSTNADDIALVMSQAGVTREFA